MPIPVAERYKARVCGRSLAGIANSNPSESIDVRLLWELCVCSQVEVSATGRLLVQRSPTDCVVSLGVIQKPQEWGRLSPRGLISYKKMPEISIKGMIERVVSSKFKRGVPWRSSAIPSSVLFHCISSTVYEVKRLSQALCWPLGLIGWSPSLSPGLRALGTYCPRFCIFYKLRQDSHTQCV